MPGQKRSNEALSEDEDELELQRDNQRISEEPEEQKEEDDVELEEQESDDDGSPSSSCNDIDEFVLVKLAEVRKEVQCPICLGIIRKTRTVMECLHRFCRECIDKSMRLGNKECPACRAHCASRRSLRDDPNYDALISVLYADIDRYEAEEFAFHEEEKARNKQIQASIAQTCRRQLEALGKKRANGKATAATSMGRSTRNLRGRRSRKSDEEDGDNDDGGKDSSSTDDHSAEVRPKRCKRWGGARSSQPSSSGDGGCEDHEAEATREILAWGRGGMRSHTRHGNPRAGAVKNARDNRLPKLIDHLGKLPQNADEMDIHVKILSLDEQNKPDLQCLNICCNPTMSIGYVCQYVAVEKGLQGNEIELLLVKGNHFEFNPSTSSNDLAAQQLEPILTNPSTSSNVLAAEPPEDTLPNPLTDELQLLEEHQTLFDVAKTSGQNNLTIAYRKKLCS